MSLRQQLGRIGRRWRLAAAAACLLLAGVTALEDLGSAATPEASPAPRVVVAARTLPAGHVLAASDLTRARAPAGGPVAQPRRLTGRVLAGPVARGEPITVLRLVDAGLTTGLPPGTVALPVDVTTDVRGLVSPGGRIDLLAVPASDPSGEDTGASGRARQSAQRLADRVLVLATLAAEPSAGTSGCRLVLALTRDDALRIAGARATRSFQVAALPP